MALLLNDILGHDLALSHEQHWLGGVRLLQSNVLGLRLLIKARVDYELLSMVRHMEHRQMDEVDLLCALNEKAVEVRRRCVALADDLQKQVRDCHRTIGVSRTDLSLLRDDVIEDVGELICEVAVSREWGHDDVSQHHQVL